MAQKLPFAPDLRELADKIVDRMKQSGGKQYNGLHLRLEKDAKDWITIFGGKEVQRVLASTSCLSALQCV